MQRIYKLIFLYGAIPVAIITSILSIFRSSLFHPLIDGIIAGSIYGGFMSLSIGLIHELAVRRLPYPIQDDSFNARHVRELDLEVPFSQAYKMCLETYPKIGPGHIISEDINSGKIRAYFGSHWTFYSNLVVFELTSVNNNLTHIVISTRPVVGYQIVDYGVGLNNIEKIVAYLKRNSSSGNYQIVNK